MSEHTKNGFPISDPFQRFERKTITCLWPQMTVLRVVHRKASTDLAQDRMRRPSADMSVTAAIRLLPYRGPAVIMAHKNETN